MNISDIIPITIMFIMKKKFKRKKGQVIFYYIVEHYKYENRYKIRNIMYLGTAKTLLNN